MINENLLPLLERIEKLEREVANLRRYSHEHPTPIHAYLPGYVPPLWPNQWPSYPYTYTSTNTETK